MISTFFLRPAGHALTLVLVVADSVLAPQIPELPDWDETFVPPHG